MNSRNTHLVSIGTTLAAASFAVVVSTGALVIGLALFGASSGRSLADLFADVFPRFRSGAGPGRFPVSAYAVFFLYVIAAAQIAILSRRELMKRRRRH